MLKDENAHREVGRLIGTGDVLEEAHAVSETTRCQTQPLGVVRLAMGDAAEAHIIILKRRGGSRKIIK